jgi:hypothetical protein
VSEAPWAAYFGLARTPSGKSILATSAAPANALTIEPSEDPEMLTVETLHIDGGQIAGH